MTNVMQSATDRQFDLEGLMVGIGEKAHRDHIIQAKQKGQEAQTSYGQFLVKAGVEPVSDKIWEYYETATSGKTGRKTTCVTRLQELVDLFGDVETVMDKAGYIALKNIIDQVSTDNKAQSTAIAIGSQLEDEARFKAWRDNNQWLFDKINKDVDKRSQSGNHKKRVMRRSMNQDPNTEDWEGWGLRARLQLGMVLLELAIQATGVAVLRKLNEGRNKTSYYIQPTADTLEWIKDRGEHTALLCPSWMPCVIPPKDWTTPFDGGYHSDRAQAGMKLIKPVKNMQGQVKKNYLQEMADRAHEMPEIYEAVNAMQRTPWQINPDVFPVFEHVWANQGDEGRAGLPAWISYEPKDVMPPYPKGEGQEEERKWKRRASDMWGVIARENSRVIQTSKIRFIAGKLADEPEIYFPYQLDFRGRVYASPVMLHPQGSDLARGLLRFANGKPLTDQTAYEWWCIHGANVWGQDKIRLDERVAWVEANHAFLERIGRDPFANTEWQEADSPWQALAWTMEYARRIDEGDHFESHLPVQLDGSCNGLQHFSAMLRDSGGGEATNLLPKDEPQDIYQRVANRTTEKLRLIASDSGKDPEEKVMAERWLAIGIDRKTTKRAVMIRPYGGTRRATQQYVYEHLWDDRTHGEREVLNPDDPQDVYRASLILSKVIYESLDEIVVASAEAMTWLQQVAKLASAEELPVTWTTPVGFHVLQAYPNIKLHRVETMLGDSTIKLSVRTGQRGLDKSKQSTGISPNFVHSLDAAALIRYVCFARRRGVEDFSLIHDSYGTHAADTQASVDSLREAFVDIYQRHDPLREFRDEIAEMLTEARQKKIPELPERGNLEIEDVLRSQYFFA